MLHTYVALPSDGRWVEEGIVLYRNCWSPMAPEVNCAVMRSHGSATPNNIVCERVPNKGVIAGAAAASNHAQHATNHGTRRSAHQRC